MFDTLEERVVPAVPVNPSFESGLSGWSIVGSENPAGIGSSISAVGGGTSGAQQAQFLVPNQSRTPFGWVGTTASLKSSDFSALINEQLTVDWQGVASGDWWHAKGELYRSSDNVLIATFFNGQGTTTAYSPATVTVPATDTYYVQFQGGTFDSTFGGFAGASLFIDNVRTNATPSGVSAGGPYSTSEGNSVTLNGSGTSPIGAPLTFSWDVNGDGIYGDVTGQNPTLTWAQLQALGINDGPSVHNVSVQVTDGVNTTTSAATTLTVNNTAPTVSASLNPPTSIAFGGSVTGSASFTDPAGAVDNNYTVAVNYGDGAVPGTPPFSTTYGTGIVLGHTYFHAGSNNVVVQVTDKDGGLGASAPITVTVAAPTTVYVNKAWAGSTVGSDPDGAGPAHYFGPGGDAFDTIQAGISALDSVAGGTVIVYDGTYPEAVTVDRSLTLQENGAVSVNMNTLSSNGGVTTTLNGMFNATAGAIAFNDNVRLSGTTTLTATGNVIFDGTVQSPGTAFALTVNTAGTTSFNFAVGGSGNPLASLTTDAPGTTHVNGGSVTTTGAQTYNDIVTLGADAVLTSTGSGNVSFASTVNGPVNLTVNTAGTTTFGGAVGGGTALTSVTTDAPGSSAINGGSVTTTGAQTYNDAVTLGGNTVLTSTGSGNVSFGSTVNGAFTLTVNTAGATTFGGAVGGSTALTSVTTDGPGTSAINGGSVRTTGAQTYNDAVTIGFDTNITTTAGGNVQFNSTVQSGHYYQRVTPSANWATAQANAAAMISNGLPGYLATIRSAGEDAFVTALLAGSAAWFGASDNAVEGTWRWVTGPDSGIQFWQGNFSGSATNGEITNWNGGEPNNSGGAENFAEILTSGKWNDLNGGSALPYIVEFGATQALTVAAGTGSVTFTGAAGGNNNPFAAVTVSGSTITVGAGITAQVGNVQLNATGDINQNGGTVATDGFGGVTYSGNNITMADGTQVSTRVGNIQFIASGDVRVTQITASAGGSATITTGGSILDDNINSSTISASSVTLMAGGEIGQPGATAQIGTVTPSLSASASDVSAQPNHGIWIGNTSTVNVVSATTANGVIVLDNTSGTMTATSVAATGGNVRLRTLTSGDIAVKSASAAGNTVRLDSVGAIVDGDSGPDDNDVTASSLSMSAVNGIGTAGNPLDTTVGTLAAAGSSVFAGNTGSLTIGSINVFGVTVNGATSTAGAINVSTSADLTVSNAVTATGGSATLSGDTGGAGATVTLNANVAGSSATVNGGAGADTFNINTTGGTLLNVDGKGGADRYTVLQSAVNAAGINISDSGASGTDVVTSNTANAGPETIGVTPTQVTRTASGTIAYSGIETLNVNGSNGSTGVFPTLTGDTFNVTPSATTTYNIDGLNPALPNSPGDTLVYNAGGVSVNDTGFKLQQAGKQDVNYVRIETVVLSNLPITVTGTSGDDTLTVTATNATDGSYVLNGGPTVQFTGAQSFTFDSDGGSDTFNIINPPGGLFAPAGGIVYLAGTGAGTGTGDNDVLNLSGGTGFNETYDIGVAAGLVAGGTNLGAGTITTTNAPVPTMTQLLKFTGLEGPITDTAPVTNVLTVNATDEANHITLANGAAGFDTLSVDNGAAGNYTPQTFQNKNAVTINAGVTGADLGDTINITYTTAATGLNGPVNVNGNAGGDTFNIQSNTPASVTTNLNGNAGADSFIFSAGKVLTGNIDGGSQNDTIDWTGYGASRNVHLTARGGIDGFTGTDSSITGTFTNADNLLAPAANGDSLTQDINTATTWNITSNNNGNVNVAGPARTATFQSFESLVGSPNGNDSFVLSDGVGLTGTVNGRGGNDSLDYSAYATGINVNLTSSAGVPLENGSSTTINVNSATNIFGGAANGIALGVGGDVGSSIENVYGGSGNDVIAGDQDNNILGDGFGSDILTAGAGDDTFLLKPGNPPAGGGVSQDQILDLSGNDTLDFSTAVRGVTVDMDLLDTYQTIDAAGNQLNLERLGGAFNQAVPTAVSPFENFRGSVFNDVTYIRALPNILRNVDGNLPVVGGPGVPPGDTLFFDGQGQPVLDTGFSLTSQGIGTVTYQSIETLFTPNASVAGRIIDNGDVGFGLQGPSGDWTYQTGIGFGGDITYPTHIGLASDVATWTFNGLTPGTYRVSATWVPQPNLATNATYSLLDGGALFAAVPVNQQAPPNDFTDGGVGWKDLGKPVTIGSHSLTVRLPAFGANGFVFADAIRVERYTTPGPEVEVYDGTAAVTSGASDDFGTTSLNRPLVKTLTIQNPGTADLTVSNLALPAGLTTDFVNTTVHPGNSYSFNVIAPATSITDYQGQLSFTTNDIDEANYHFFISAVVSTRQVVDDGSVAYATTGSWAIATNQGFGSNVHFAPDTGNPAGAATATSTWTFQNLVPGSTYRVSATWAVYDNRATDAPFTIASGATTFSTRVNQQLTPGDFTDLGVGWKDLSASFVVPAGQTSLTVSLGNNAGNQASPFKQLYVVADGVRIEQVVDPHAVVTVGATNVPDDVGVFDFGSTPRGTAVSRTFTITNTGATNLTVTGPVTFPGGFSMDPTSPFGLTPAAVVLATGQSTSFTLRMDAGAAGNVSGPVTFQTSAQDQNVYNFTVKGVVAGQQIIDDTAASFAGSWNVVSGSGGYGGSYHTAQGGTGSSTATWSFTGLTPGNYRVSVTYKTQPNVVQATNAPFTVTSGANTVTVAVNQEIPAGDLADQNTFWEDLATTFAVDNSGTLTVQLTNAANEFVTADAVRIERLVDPQVQVLNGSSVVADGSGLVDIGTTLVGTPATVTLTLNNLGGRAMALGTPTVPPGYVVVSSPTSIPAGGSATLVLQLPGSAAAGLYSGAVRFGADDLDDSSFTFTVRGTVTNTVPPVQILDNGQAGFSTTGSWVADVPGKGYNGNILYNQTPGSGSTATWSFTGLAAGLYRVSATWVAQANLTTTAPYTIKDNATVVGTAIVNQQAGPSGFVANGGTWQDLGGPYVVNSGTLNVTLSDVATTAGFVFADAIRIDPVSVPEVQVTDNGSATVLTNGTSVVNFGSTPRQVPSAPVTRSFTIANKGNQVLTIPGVTVPVGYTLLTPPAGSVAAGGTTTFTIGLNTDVAGSYTGTVQVTTNDPANSQFRFNVTGQIAAGVFVDDSSGSGFGTTAGWTAASGQGYLGTVRFASAGTGSAVATWTFNGLVPGASYHVAATWSKDVNRATNAPYSVYNGAAIPANLIATTLLNQQQAPADFTDLGAIWEDLGGRTYTVGAGGTLTVTLNNSANGFVIADAVRVERVWDPDIQVLQGTTNLENAESTVDFGSTLVTTPVQKAFTAKNVGVATLNLNSLSLPAGYSLVGAPLPATLAPGASATFTVQLDALATGTYAGTVTIGTNDSDENAFHVTITGTVAQSLVKDDGDPGVTYTAGWTAFTGQGYNGNLHFAAAGTGSAVATWTFNGLKPGTYHIAATWSPNPNRATNAPYTLTSGANTLTTTVNQQATPSTFNDLGTNWQDLAATFVVDASGTLTVKLSNNANGYVIADAIRIERLPPQMAAGGVAHSIGIVPTLTASQLKPIVAAAESSWIASGKATAANFATVQFQITDLPGAQLGGAAIFGHTVFIDTNAAGYAWFVDPTPNDDSEFRTLNSPAAGHMDLLTVVEHELGHVLGLDDLPDSLPASLMTTSLSTGARRGVTTAPVSVPVDPAAVRDQLFARAVSGTVSQKLSNVPALSGPAAFQLDPLDAYFLWLAQRRS